MARRSNGQVSPKSELHTRSEMCPYKRPVRSRLSEADVMPLKRFGYVGAALAFLDQNALLLDQMLHPDVFLK